MWSRRWFLRCCAASSAGLLWPRPAYPEGNATVEKNEPEEKKGKPKAPRPDPLFTPAARKAVAAGLKYLTAAQHKDGSFGTRGFKGNVGLTSLCGLAFLAAGRRPGAGAPGKVLDAALDFVLGKEQARPRGFLHNRNASPHGPMYDHAFAVQLLATAHDRLADKKRAGKVHAVLARAVALTLASQNAEKAWRYRPTSRDSDLTVTAAQLCALRMARDAGIGVPRAALAGAAGYVKKCAGATGGFHYMPRAGKPSWGRTAAGVQALYSAGLTRGAEVRRGLAYLLANRPDPKAKKLDLHHYHSHFYAALATWSAGGDTRKKWYEGARDEMVARQLGAGNWASPICPHYATAMALIALQAPSGVLSPEF
jgi:hypothetical protein